jgi:hypothetical protein
MASLGRYIFIGSSVAWFIACSSAPGDDDGSTSTEAAGGSGSATGGTPGEGELFVPARIKFSESADEGEGVDVVAATLDVGPSGQLQVLLALFNGAETGACSGGVGIEFFDLDEQPLGTATANMYGAGLYRADEYNLAVGCIDPGQRGMAAATDIDAAIALQEVASVVYRFTYFSTEFFAGGLTPLTQFTVDSVMRVESAAGSGFSGVLHNGLEATVEEPTVIVFALDAVGRPVATVEVTGDEPLLPHEQWEFLTSPVFNAGVSEVTYALGDLQL